MTGPGLVCREFSWDLVEIFSEAIVSIPLQSIVTHLRCVCYCLLFCSLLVLHAACPHVSCHDAQLLANALLLHPSGAQLQVSAL